MKIQRVGSLHGVTGFYNGRKIFSRNKQGDRNHKLEWEEQDIDRAGIVGTVDS